MLKSKNVLQPNKEKMLGKESDSTETTPCLQKAVCFFNKPEAPPAWFFSTNLQSFPEQDSHSFLPFSCSFCLPILLQPSQNSVILMDLSIGFSGAILGETKAGGGPFSKAPTRGLLVSRSNLCKVYFWFYNAVVIVILF